MTPTKRKLGSALFAAMCLSVWVGCGRKQPSGSATADTASQVTLSPQAQAEADEVFANTCAACHGAGGHGDGPGSAALNPKPRNFTLADWQAKVDDDHIGKVIKYGGAAVGLSPMMPAHPQFIEKPEIIAGLVHHIRSLKGK
jgi:mono/diheme cytochrome c family protein